MWRISIMQIMFVLFVCFLYYFCYMNIIQINENSLNDFSYSHFLHGGVSFSCAYICVSSFYLIFILFYYFSVFYFLSIQHSLHQELCCRGTNIFFIYWNIPPPWTTYMRIRLYSSFRQWFRQFGAVCFFVLVDWQIGGCVHGWIGGPKIFWKNYEFVKMREKSGEMMRALVCFYFVIYYGCHHYARIFVVAEDRVPKPLLKWWCINWFMNHNKDEFVSFWM